MAINEGFEGGSDEGEETRGELVFLDVERLVRSKFDDGLKLEETRREPGVVGRCVDRFREWIDVCRTVWFK